MRVTTFGNYHVMFRTDPQRASSPGSVLLASRQTAIPVRKASRDSLVVAVPMGWFARLSEGGVNCQGDGSREDVIDRWWTFTCGVEK